MTYLRKASYWVRNPDALKKIMELWLAGYSAGEILLELGAGTELSRNAIIGKLHRQGLHGHMRSNVPKSTPNKSGPPKKRAKRYRVVKPLRIDKPIIEAPTIFGPVGLTNIPEENPVTAVPLYKAKAHHCRWPVGHMIFCGARIVSGARLSYCQTHHDRAVNNSYRGPYNVRPRYSKYR